MNTELINDVTQISMFGVDLAVIGTIALILIMITTGLILQISHFKPVFTTLKSIYFGLFAQLIILPWVALALVYFFQPSLYTALGLIILSCCPCGATSNFLRF